MCRNPCLSRFYPYSMFGCLQTKVALAKYEQNCEKQPIKKSILYGATADLCAAFVRRTSGLSAFIHTPGNCIAQFQPFYYKLVISAASNSYFRRSNHLSVSEVPEYCISIIYSTTLVLLVFQINNKKKLSKFKKKQQMCANKQLLHF